MNSCHCLFPRLFVCSPLLLEAITKDRKLETVHLLHYTYLYMSQNLSVVREQCADRFAHRWTKFLQLRSSRGHSCVSVGCELVSKLIIQNLMSDFFPTWTWNSRHVVLFCGWICRAVTSTVDCLNQKHECSQQATRESVMGYFSLVYSFKHELNILLDEKINLDSVALVFSCLPGQFAGYMSCFFLWLSGKLAMCFTP